MSVQALAAVFALEIESPTVKLVLLALANHTDADFRCWPSQKTLASLTSLSERAIRNALEVLSERGLIERKERRRPDGSRASDIITLKFLQPAPAAGSDQQPARRAGGGAPDAGGGARRAGHEPANNLPSEANASSGRARRICPEEWKPSEADLSVADKEGLSGAEIERETAKFRDHTFGTARSAWSNTFRNWMRRAGDLKREGKLGSDPHKPPGSGGTPELPPDWQAQRIAFLENMER